MLPLPCNGTTETHLQKPRPWALVAFGYVLLQQHSFLDGGETDKEPPTPHGGGGGQSDPVALRPPPSYLSKTPGGGGWGGGGVAYKDRARPPPPPVPLPTPDITTGQRHPFYPDQAIAY